MASKYEQTTVENAHTKPEVALASDFMLNFDDDSQGDGIVIFIPDTGNSVFRPSKVKKDKSGLSTAVYEICNVGGFGPEPLGIKFDNGGHAKQRTFYKLQVLTFPTLAESPADLQREKFAAIVADASYSEEIRKAAQANLDKLTPVTPEPKPETVTPEAVKKTAK
jgi:hypothetical protein